MKKLLKEKTIKVFDPEIFKTGCFIKLKVASPTMKDGATFRILSYDQSYIEVVSLANEMSEVGFLNIKDDKIIYESDGSYTVVEDMKVADHNFEVLRDWEREEEWNL